MENFEHGPGREYSAMPGDPEGTAEKMNMAKETANINEAESDEAIQKYMDEVIAAGLTNDQLDKLEQSIHKLRSSQSPTSH